MLETLVISGRGREIHGIERCALCDEGMTRRPTIIKERETADRLELITCPEFDLLGKKICVNCMRDAEGPAASDSDYKPRWKHEPEIRRKIDGYE